MPLIYELADDRDLPEAARSEDSRMPWRLRARHRVHEPEGPVNGAGDDDIVALLYACRSARDRLVVVLMARAGLRRGELCGLRRSDLHAAGDSRRIGCEVEALTTEQDPTTSRRRPESSTPRRPGPGLPSHHFDARTGPTPAVAARLAARGRLLDRPLYLGDDPVAPSPALSEPSHCGWRSPSWAPPRPSEVRPCSAGD